MSDVSLVAVTSITGLTYEEIRDVLHFCLGNVIRDTPKYDDCKKFLSFIDTFGLEGY